MQQVQHVGTALHIRWTQILSQGSFPRFLPVIIIPTLRKSPAQSDTLLFLQLHLSHLLPGRCGQIQYCTVISFLYLLFSFGKSDDYRPPSGQIRLLHADSNSSLKAPYRCSVPKFRFALHMDICVFRDRGRAKLNLYERPLSHSLSHVSDPSVWWISTCLSEMEQPKDRWYKYCRSSKTPQ